MFLVSAATAGCCATIFFYLQSKRWQRSATEANDALEESEAELGEIRLHQVRSDAELEKQREFAAAQLDLFKQTQAQLEDKFRALASDALRSNSQMFLDRSKEQLAHAISPVTDTLTRFDQQIHLLEQARVGAYASLSTQVQELTLLQERVRISAEGLKNALRSPVQRGRWGEVQLRRVVELAGMLEHCDFAEQQTLFGERTQRPDLIVRLPNQCHVAVDAKVPLEAYLRAAEAIDETVRVQALTEHSRQVRAHLKALGDKAYWQRLGDSPQFVVAFLPLESLYSAALEHDPTLLEFGVNQRVILATPTTLITLLLIVSQGWKQQHLAENAERVKEIGSELYNRIYKMHEHFIDLGASLGKTVDYYNKTVGSLERNVMSSARKFKELDAVTSPETLEQTEKLEHSPRTLDTPKWQQPTGTR